MNHTGCGDTFNGPASDRPPVLSVLYVDDEPFLLDVCKLYLERHPDISVSIASSVDTALQLMDRELYDVVVSDYHMPGRDGSAFLRILREKNCQVPFIFFTCRGRGEVMAKIPESGNMYFLEKGGDPQVKFKELEEKIRGACSRHPVTLPFQESRARSPAAPVNGLMRETP
jgi:DNA-binding response OmpR family regulator